MRYQPISNKIYPKIGAISLLIITFFWTVPPTVFADFRTPYHSNLFVFNFREKAELQAIYGQKPGDPKTKLVASLEDYLKGRNSPLADCSEIILAQPNWKKILSLANAESSMGKRYVKSTNNLWGVGGSNLWIMGDNLCDAIPEMNNFLENYPKRSTVKYKDMPIEKMCGLYKQPCYAGHHWITNNTIILGHLNNLEQAAFGPQITDLEPSLLAQK